MHKMNILKENDAVILIDQKGKRHFILLKKGKTFHSQWGSITHEEIIGKEEGVIINLRHGASFVVFRPTLWEFALHMQRISGIIYPKDMGFIWIWGDIFPGARVIEGGVGSGAMLIVLSRAVGERGEVISYEIREDMIKRAKENLKNFYGEEPSWVKIKKEDIYKEIQEKEVDRIILDVPEPWRVISHAKVSLKGGGIIIAYLPSIIQASRFHRELLDNEFLSVETVELLIRSWHIEGKSVRPEHRMVGHTGFLVKGRKVL